MKLNKIFLNFRVEKRIVAEYGEKIVTAFS